MASPIVHESPIPEACTPEAAELSENDEGSSDDQLSDDQSQTSSMTCSTMLSEAASMDAQSNQDECIPEVIEPWDELETPSSIEQVLDSLSPEAAKHLRTEISDLREQRDKLERSHELIGRECDRLHKECTTRNDREEAAKKTIAEMESQMQEASKNICWLAAQTSRENDALRATNTRLRQLRSMNDELQKQVAAHLEQHARHRDASARQDEAIALLQARLREACRQRNVVAEKTGIATFTLQTHLLQLQELRMKNDETTKQLAEHVEKNSLLQEADANQRQQLAHLEAEIQEAGDVIATLKENNGRLLDDMRSRIGQLQQMHQYKKNESAEIISALEQKCAMQEEQGRQLQYALHAAHDRGCRLTEKKDIQIRQLDCDRDELKSKYAELEKVALTWEKEAIWKIAQLQAELDKARPGNTLMKAEVRHVQREQKDLEPQQSQRILKPNNVIHSQREELAGIKETQAHNDHTIDAVRSQSDTLAEKEETTDNLSPSQHQGSADGPAIAELKASCIRLREATLRVADWFISNCETLTVCGALPMDVYRTALRNRTHGPTSAHRPEQDATEVELLRAPIASQLFFSILAVVQQYIGVQLAKRPQEVLARPGDWKTPRWLDPNMENLRFLGSVVALHFAKRFKGVYDEVAPEQCQWLNYPTRSWGHDREAERYQEFCAHIREPLAHFLTTAAKGIPLGMAFQDNRPTTVTRFRWSLVRETVPIEAIRRVICSDAASKFLFPALKLHTSETDLAGDTLLNECRLSKATEAEGSSYQVIWLTEVEMVSLPAAGTTNIQENRPSIKFVYVRAPGV